MTKDRLPDLRTTQNIKDNDPDTAYVGINTKDIDKIKQLVEEVKRLHSTILAAPQVDDRTKEELEEKMVNIKKLANNIRQNLKKTEQHHERSKTSSNKTQAKLRIEKSQHVALSRKFIDVMNAYRNAEIEYRERCKAHIQ